LPDQGRLEAFKDQLLANDPAQRRATADTLRMLGDPWMYQAAVQIRRDLDASDVEARRRAVLALGDLGDPLSADKLLFTLIEEKDPIVKRGAAMAAGQVGAWRCLEVLMTTARTDTDSSVRWGAITGLGRLASLSIGDRARVHAFLAALAEHEPDEKARTAARQAAEAWRAPRSLD
jgi:HEAT repeat protein